MKITAIHVFGQELPVASGAYRMSHSTLESLETTIVQVVTARGIAGYGETGPVGTLYAPEHVGGARAALAEIAPLLLGQDARLIGTCGRAMDGALNPHRYAKAALDIALWDILGKHCGMRVCDLLGGALYNRVPSYAVIDAAAPDVAANRGMTVADAMMLSDACRDLSFALEQPCNTFEELVALRPSAMRAVRDICRARRRPHTCDDTWGGDIIAAACVHVGATVQPDVDRLGPPLQSHARSSDPQAFGGQAVGTAMPCDDYAPGSSVSRT